MNRKTSISFSLSHTKRGPGRRHSQGDGTHKTLTMKQRRAGMFGKGLRKAITAKNLKAIQEAA